MPPILIIADPHISRHASKNKPVSDRLGALAAKYPGAWLVVAGDVVDDGHPDQYTEAERLLRPWRGRILLAQGNHDAGPLGLTWDMGAVARWAGLCQRLEARAEAVIPQQNGPAWRICTLDSVNATPGPWDLARGQLGAAELERGRIAIERGHRQGQRVALVTHHDPMSSDPLMLMEDASAYLMVAREADAVVWGHTHRYWLGDDGVLMRSLEDFRGGMEDFLVL